MSWLLTGCVIGGYLLLSLLLLPVQYRYVKSLKEQQKQKEAKGISQQEMYENMSFEEQLSHYHAQGLFFLGANLFATLMYNWKHKEKKTESIQK